jgi:allantoin racemase
MPVDDVSAAVKLIESLHGMKLATSKQGDFDFPVQKNHRLF